MKTKLRLLFLMLAVNIILIGLVLLPAYVLIGLGILENFGLVWFAITAVAGFSSWARTMVYDNIKIQFQAQTAVPGDDVGRQRRRTGRCPRAPGR